MASLTEVRLSNNKLKGEEILIIAKALVVIQTPEPGVPPKSAPAALRRTPKLRQPSSRSERNEEHEGHHHLVEQLAAEASAPPIPSTCGTEC